MNVMYQKMTNSVGINVPEIMLTCHLYFPIWPLNALNNKTLVITVLSVGVCYWFHVLMIIVYLFFF